VGCLLPVLLQQVVAGCLPPVFLQEVAAVGCVLLVGL
jgi:hypothetical protein